jgi:hypothetical protein
MLWWPSFISSLVKCCIQIDAISNSIFLAWRRA